MASKSSASGISRTCTPMPMEDVQGDNRWMDMVRILINSALLFSPITIISCVVVNLN